MIMKRLIAFSTSLLLLMSCLAGCGQEKKEVEIPENYLYTELGYDGEIRYVTAPPTEPTETPEETTEPEPVEIDVFENIGLNIDPLLGYYPFHVDISVDPANSSIGTDDYVVEITSANTEIVKISVTIDTEEIAGYLEENNYILASTSKDYEISVKDMIHSLVSLNCLNEENFKAIDEAARNEVAREQEMEQELTLVSVYANLPADGIDYVLLAKDENRYHENNFDYTAVTPDPYGLYMIYKDAADYYAVYCTTVFNADSMLLIETEGLMQSSMFFNLYHDTGALSTSTTFDDEASAFASVEAHAQDLRENHVPDIQFVTVEEFTPAQEEETTNQETEQPTT